MKHHTVTARLGRARTLSAAIIVGLLAGAAPASADDTDIYVGAKAGHSGVRPNVLFILDTSGSMGTVVPGTGRTRMREMQDAFRRVLTNTTDINAGLMRFHKYEGGPVMYPIKDLEEAASEEPLLLRVSRNNDDGAETLHDGEVKLNEINLTLGVTEIEVPPKVESKPFNVRMKVGGNMAERRIDDLGTSPPTENSSFSFRAVNNWAYALSGYGAAPFVGLRFEGLPSDIAGARIDQAAIEMTAFGISGVFNTDWELGVRGHAVAEEPALVARTGADTLCSALAASQVAQMDSVCRHLRSNEFPGSRSEELTFGTTAGSNGDKLLMDVQPLLQTMVFTPGFTGAAVGFSTASKRRNGASVAAYAAHTSNPQATFPELRGMYTPGAGKSRTPRARRVALRFRDVRIPQGSKISDARVEFTPLSASSEPMKLNISFVAARREGGAGNLEPHEFTTANRSLSNLRGAGRGATAVVWDVLGSESWTAGNAVVTANLRTALDPVVQDADWCGGNDLIVLIEPTADTAGRIGSRMVASIDETPAATGELFGAPRLRIQLAADSRQSYGPGEGCTVASKSLRPKARSDDARSNSGTKPRFDYTSARIDADRTHIGMRFPNVPIPKGATIQRANLYVGAFTAYDSSDIASVQWQVYGDASSNSPSFTTADTGPHTRIATAAKVTSRILPETAVRTDQDMLLASVGDVVKEIVSRGDWQDGNALSIIGKRLLQKKDIEFNTFDGNPELAARLDVEFQFNVGDLTIKKNPGITVREHLIQLVDDLTPNGDTPTVDTYFEAARYFRGEGVHYGLTRGGPHVRERGTSIDRNHARRSRISHRRSWTNGNAPLPNGCTTHDYNSWACSLEQVDVGDTPNYISPIEDSCQGNYIVLLTDGFARLNPTTTLEEAMIGGSCQTRFDNGTNQTINQGQKCGVDLARFLKEKDQSVLPGSEPQTVETHTIGFAERTELLVQMAKAGGGTFEPANNAQQLEAVFNNLFASIRGSRSFTPPALSTSAFNDLYTDEHVYLSMFEPGLEQGWNGNLKKYRLCHTSLGTPDGAGNLLGVGCRIGEVLDEPGHSATNSGGKIKDSANSYWNNFADGSKVELGGAVGALRAKTLDYDDRVIYMYPDTINRPQDQTGNDKGKLRLLQDDSPTNGLIDYYETTAVGGGAIETSRMMGMPSVSSADRDELARTIAWARGKDTEQETNSEPKANAVTGSNIRYAMGDPLHASPVIVNYGVSSSTGKPIAKLFVPTNDGSIRMIDATNGIEEWVFYPQATMRKQNTLRQGRAGDRIYGLDSTPVVWIKDVNGDKVITKSEGDRVRLIFGMRRGGSNYYALDVTPATAITAARSVAQTTPSIVPKFLWRIDGGGGDFGRLGQTWSRPRLGNIRVGRRVVGGSADTQTRVALFFGGGYDEVQDSGFGALGAGNAVYVVDAETGERLIYASSIGATAHGLGEGVTVPDMQFPIPSDPTLIDVDGDGTVDRLVIGDTGGQVWRMDFRAKAGVQDGLQTVVGRLASTSFAKTITDFGALNVKLADQRKFFYSPAIYRAAGDTVYSNTANYDLVVIGSGNRATPLEERVSDRLFFLRDTRSGSLFGYDTDGNGLADGMRSGGGQSSTQTIFTGLAASFGTTTAKTSGEIVSLGRLDKTGVSTTTVNGQTQVGRFNGASTTLLQQGRGFAAELATKGEKALSRPLLIAGKVAFTTYLPVVDGATAECGGAEGVGRLHVMNLLSGKSASESVQLGSGIPSQPAVFFRNLGKKGGVDDPDATLLIGTGGGTDSYKLPGLLNNPNRNTFGGSYRQIGEGDRKIEFGLYWYEDPDN